MFCQVNFWFIVHLLNQSEKKKPTFLIRPKSRIQYGFGRLNKTELVSIYENRLLLTKLDKLTDLWELYKNNNLEQLLKTARELENIYPFILTAVKAHIERIPAEGKFGEPNRSLPQIMKELNTEEFGSVFKEFSKRDSIHGFGGLQVKRRFEEIKNKLK